jgi:predicted metalloprotease with PDZ domain
VAERLARLATGQSNPLTEIEVLRPEALVQNVISGGAGELAGIAPGDLLLAVDGLRANAENLERLFARAAADGPVTVHLFRRDELMSLEAAPRTAPSDTCELMTLDQAPDPATQARSAWLASVV